MLKTSGIFKITVRENLRGQLLWSSGIAGFVLLILMAVLSGSALSHQNRIIDVFSYFVADQLLLMVGIFSGASICSSDFSARGISELYIPAGVPRYKLLLTRVAAYALVLFLLAVALYLVKATLLPLLADHPAAPDAQLIAVMFLFSWSKATTALCLATLLGSLARPLYSILGTLVLFSFGHLTSTLDSLLTSTTLTTQDTEMSWSTSLLYSALKIWNPNLLVVESVQGQWIQPTLNLIFQAITWAIGFMCVSLGLTIARVNRIDIRG